MERIEHLFSVILDALDQIEEELQKEKPSPDAPLGKERKVDYLGINNRDN